MLLLVQVPTVLKLFVTELILVGTPVTSVSADIAAVKTGTDGIQTDLDNATDGLGAIKSAVDGVQTDLDDATNGLAAIKTAVVGVQTDLDNTTDGLGALKTLIDSVQSSVSAIQNNTRLTTSIAPEMDTPDSGSTYHKFYVNRMMLQATKKTPIQTISQLFLLPVQAVTLLLLVYSKMLSTLLLMQVQNSQVC